MEPIPVPSEPTTRPSTHFTPLDDLTSSFLLNAKIQTYSHQYSSIYFLRLHEMKKAVSQVARAKWANAPGGPQHVPRVLDIKKGKLCYVIGTVYMDMRMKPSILDDIAKDEFNLAAPPSSKYFGDDDAINLEDESGRVKLVGEVIAKAGIVTGIIIGALGMETPAGDFEVVDYCFAGLPTQSPLSGSALSKSDKMDIDGEPSSSSSGEWIALVSGLEIGLTSGTAADSEFSETSRQLLIEFLLGEAGGVEDQAFSSQISRLIILGNSVVPIIMEEEDETKSKRFNASKTKYDPAPLYTLSSILTEISRALPTHILPGSSDPTGTSLPQQPLPRPMFGKELSSKGKEAFVCETNPTWIGIGDCEMLAISGQTIEDIYKYVESPTRLEMATRTLLWRHMAPTAPDTLWCYPYLNEDPFILTRCPHIYVLGNQPEFQTDIVEGTEGQRTRIILLPKFSETGCLTLVNTNSLEVKTISFKVSAP